MNSLNIEHKKARERMTIADSTVYPGHLWLEIWEWEEGDVTEDAAITLSRSEATQLHNYLNRWLEEAE